MTSLSAYVRVSMDKTGSGLGVSNQREAILKWAAENKHTVTRFYEDNDISATSGKRRPGFEQLLADAPPEIVVWHQDRLLRVTKDLEKILDAGTTVHQVTSGSLDLATPAGKAIARTMAAWATYEGEQKAARMTLRNTSDAEKGRTFLRREVFGNNLDGTLKKDEAQAIRDAAEDLQKNNISLGGVAKRWNAAGLRTPFSRSTKAIELDLPGRGGNLWTYQTVKQLLAAERLKGYRTYRGKTVELVNWTPVLDKDKWQDLQDFLDTTRTGQPWVKKAPNSIHLLTGIMSCPVDGCHKKVNIGYSAKDQRHYICSTRGHGTKVAEPLERVVVQRFILALSSPSAQSKMFKTSGEDVGKIRSERLQLIKAHDAWMNEALTAGLSPAMIAVRDRAHTDALTLLDARILDLDKDQLFEGLRYVFDSGSMLSALQGIKTFEADALKRWEEIPMLRRRAIVEALFDNITYVKGARGHRFKDSDVLMTPSKLLLELEAQDLTIS